MKAETLEESLDWDYLDNVRGVGFDIEINLSANGRAMIFLRERGDENAIGCLSPTRAEAYEWIGKKIEELITGRKEMVPMAEKEKAGG